MSKKDVFQNLRGSAPDELLDFLGQVVQFLPDEFRFRLRQVMRALPAEGDNMHRVLELIRNQWRDIQFERWVRISIVGPAHTGKASLLEAIQSREVRTVGPLFEIVEAPGLEEYLGYGSDHVVPDELVDSDMAILVLDGQLGVSDSTIQLVNRLEELGKPLLVVLNKMDLVQHPAQVLREARKRLRWKVFPASAVTDKSIERLFGAIASVDSRALYPLTQTFPDFRSSICSGVVTQAAVAASLVGGLKIPVSDLLPLTAIQTAMLLKVARKGAHELGERYPRQKTLIGVSVAGIWTFTMGRMAIRYFQRFSDLLQGAAKPGSLGQAEDPKGLSEAIH
jgi:GTP-binding protein EngB required for normal cell division